jgi:hypothetical protein
MFQWLRSFFSARIPPAPPDEGPTEPKIESNRCPCGNKLIFDDFTITVRGVEFMMGSNKLCPACVQKDCEDNGTTCAICGGPIVPGMQVGVAPNSSPHDFSFTHMRQGCSPGVFTICGRWGRGRLITLHELNPEKFPEGTITPAHAALVGRRKISVSSRDI